MYDDEGYSKTVPKKHMWIVFIVFILVRELIDNGFIGWKVFFYHTIIDFFIFLFIELIASMSLGRNGLQH